MLSLALCLYVFTSCSDDDDTIENGIYVSSGKYAFVGRTYEYIWTLQNTTTQYSFVISFPSDSTYTFEPFNYDTGESKRTKVEESYYVDEDGVINFYGLSEYKTNIKGYRITLYKAYFSDDDITTMHVYRRLLFSSGNSRSDWVDFELQ